VQYEEDMDGPAAHLRARVRQGQQYEQMLEKMRALKRVQWLQYPAWLLSNQCSRWNIIAKSSSTMARKCAEYVRQVWV